MVPGGYVTGNDPEMQEVTLRPHGTSRSFVYPHIANILTVHISDILTFAADAITWEGVECYLVLMQRLWPSGRLLSAVMCRHSSVRNTGCTPALVQVRFPQCRFILSCTCTACRWLAQR